MFVFKPFQTQPGEVFVCVMCVCVYCRNTCVNGLYVERQQCVLGQECVGVCVCMCECVGVCVCVCVAEIHVLMGCAWKGSSVFWARSVLEYVCVCVSVLECVCVCVCVW